MPRFARAGLLAALLLAPLARPAHGSPGGWVYSTAYYYPTYYRVYYSAPVTVSYYAPSWSVYAVAPPVVCAPAVTVSVPAPVTVSPAPVYAVPTAAPPSQTAEPPARVGAVPPAPRVMESRSGAADKLGKTEAAGAGRVRVGFWNVSGRDLVLTIDGRPYTLPRNRNLTLDLGRTFSWRVDSRATQNETVSEGSPTLEIVLRR
jgi:hypothetical protein